MNAYKEISTGWPDNPRPYSKAQVKSLVKFDQWWKLGDMFNFVPVFHFGGNHFLDWRCVPKELMDILSDGKSQAPAVAPKQHKRKILNPHRPDTDKRGESLPALKKRKDVLYDNQGGVCHYCKNRFERKQWSVDHKLPRFRGGGNSDSNLVGCCRPCNNLKAFLTEEEFFSLQPGIIGIEGRCKSALILIAKSKDVFVVQRFGIGS